MRIGYIENGYLRAKELFDESGMPVCSLSEEKRLEYLSNGFRVVDDIDEKRLKCDNGKSVIITPYINGERISFHYDTKEDKWYYINKINELKVQLNESDYKIIKCYEAKLQGNELPYDIDAICSSRQQLRDKINELEKQLGDA